MQKDALNNVHITDEQVLMTPEQLKAAFPLSLQQEAQIADSRKTISDIIAGRDPRLLVVCGPCSIHDPETALEYARRFKALAAEVSDSLYLVMRVYFEKPRTTVGWKGLINDPHMDGSFDVEAGLQIARKLLLELVNMGLPLATEALDPNSPQYLGDLFSWSAIGARTTESQTHREMASGLSMPVGFKNGTDGSLATAINAMRAAAQPHRFVGINQAGQVALLQTQGNPDGHVILRGGKAPNYSPADVAQCEKEMEQAGLRPETALARRAGLTINRGVCVDSYLQTSNTDIYALGDCAEINGQVLPFLQPIQLSAMVLAKNLLGNNTPLKLPAMLVKIKTPELPLHLAGETQRQDLRWQINTERQGMVARGVDDADQLRAFVVSEDRMKEAFGLLKTLPM